MQRQPGELAGKDVLKRLLKEKAEIPDSKIELILEKHGLGELHSSTPCVANHLNTVLMLDTRDGQFILKVRHRKTHNRALETERIVIEPLRKSTSLPLSELVIFDGDRDAIPYPFVVTSKLPGEPGRAFFETTTVGLRKALSNQLGVVLAAIHGHGRSEDLQFRAPQRSLRLWRETLTAFFSSSEDDFGLEMRAFSPEICGEIEALVQRIPVDTVEEEETLVWGDAAFHNMVVSNGDESIEVTGVFDLESASYGIACSTSTMLREILGAENLPRSTPIPNTSRSSTGVTRVLEESSRNLMSTTGFGLRSFTVRPGSDGGGTIWKSSTGSLQGSLTD